MCCNIAASKRDHPRVCGEQFSLRPVQLRNVGSPPRVRGAVTGKVTRRVFTGITPACAGSRDVKEAAENGAKDHPRVCGEQTK